MTKNSRGICQGTNASCISFSMLTGTVCVLSEFALRGTWLSRFAQHENNPTAPQLRYMMPKTAEMCCLSQTDIWLSGVDGDVTYCSHALKNPSCLLPEALTHLLPLTKVQTQTDAFSKAWIDNLPNPNPLKYGDDQNIISAFRNVQCRTMNTLS